MGVKHRVAVLLADGDRAQRVAEQLEAHGAKIVLTSTSDELYQASSRNPIDLILIEQQLSGFLTGLEILERLFKELVRPATVLLGKFSHEEMRRVEAIGVQQVLDAETSVDTLATVILRLLGGVDHSDDVIPLPARRIVQDASYIPLLPHILIKLIAHLHDVEIDVGEVVRQISVDPLVTADVLKYANSSALGRRQKTTRISEVVSYLGARKTVAVAISTGMIRARGALLGDIPVDIHQWHRSRAVLTACTSSAFAARLELVSEESAYILGLMQDLGILLMARTFGNRYIEALLRVRDIAHLNLAHVEKEQFATTHAEVSAALLRRWELPGALVSLVLRHHDRDGSARSTTDRSFLRAMQIGEAFSDLHDNRGPQRYRVLKQLLDEYGAQAARDCHDCLAAAIARTVESNEVFSVPTPDAETLKQLLSELVTQKDLYQQVTESETTATDSTAARSSEVAANKKRRDSTCILVIDDEQSIVKLIRLYLQSQPWRVESCDRLEEAKRLAVGADLVLCDVHLGNQSGIDIVRALRRSGYSGPIVIISGDNQRGTVVAGIEAGVDDYLLKPFSRVQLIDKLRKHLDVDLVNV